MNTVCFYTSTKVLIVVVQEAKMSLKRNHKTTEYFGVSPALKLTILGLLLKNLITLKSIFNETVSWWVIIWLRRVQGNVYAFFVWMCAFVWVRMCE